MAQRQIVAWVVLLFVLLFLLCAPFHPRRCKSPGSRQALAIVAAVCPLRCGYDVTGFTPMLSALIIVGFFPETGGVRPFLHQIRTWRVGMNWYALALFGPMVLLVLDAGVNMLLGGGHPSSGWFSPHLPTLAWRTDFFHCPVGLRLRRRVRLARLWSAEITEAPMAPLGKPSYRAHLGTYHLWIIPICPHCLSLTDILVTQYLRLIATSSFTVGCTTARRGVSVSSWWRTLGTI